VAVGPIGTGQIDNVQASVIGPVRYTLQLGTVMERLVRSISGAQGQDDTYNQPKYAGLTAYDATEGVAVSQAQQITDSNVSVSATESVVDILITKKMLRTTNAMNFRVAGRIMGEAMNKKVDSDLLGLFSGLDTVFGGTSTSAAIGYYLAAVSRLPGALSSSEPAPAPYHHVIHGMHFRDIADDLLALSSSALGGTAPFPDGSSQDILEDYTFGRLLGGRVVVDNNMSVSSTSAYGATFSPDAFLFYNWMPLETTITLDPGMRGWRLMIIRDYGVSEYDGTWGYGQRFDTTVPTS
jgi:hypothetical protein